MLLRHCSLLGALCLFVGSTKIVPTGAGSIHSAADTLFVSVTSFGSFSEASRITVGPDGKVYIIDAGKNAVLIFKSPQDSPSVIGGFGWTSVTFDRPTGLATDGLNIYVSDYGNHRVQRFDRYLNLLSSLNTRDTSYAPARFGYPTGVDLTNQGELIILDSENLRAVEFSADSRFERNYGGLNTAGGKLEDPIKVCSEGNQCVYILEKKKILEFDFYGNFLRSFAQNLGGDIVGGQCMSNGIAAVCDDTLYWYDSQGSLGSKTPLDTLLAEEPISSVQDVSFYNDNLFVLTPHRCFVFKMEPFNR